jgi:uncharacterized protein (DUF2132 family)
MTDDQASSSPPADPSPARRPQRDPLHGVTLEMMLNRLVESLGWEQMGEHITIRCFTHDPSISSSLKFLRKTPWARDKVEELYLCFGRPKEPLQ